jgi:predicted Holliday junction resolvase-like endonuclease
MKLLLAGTMFLAIVLIVTLYKLSRQKDERTALRSVYEQEICRIEESLKAHADKTMAAEQRYALASDLLSKSESRMRHLLADQARQIKHARTDAVKRAAAVAHGFEGENFAPLIQEHWSHKDFRHMGDPVDFIVFSGAETVRSSPAGPEVQEIVLLDIKTGSSGLTTVQRRIRDAVVANKVKFAMYNPDTRKLRIWPESPAPNQLELPL